ncbi:MAG: hypothetical protein DWH94_00020 [Planctomycetota bacterium]|nr:MAG: hypothetical protein DWH94_00020 [Planctomycetota bacterium]
MRKSLSESRFFRFHSDRWNRKSDSSRLIRGHSIGKVSDFPQHFLELGLQTAFPPNSNREFCLF